MSTITIYTVRNADHIECGQSENYTLNGSLYSSPWYYIYDSAEYLLPAGYHAAESTSGTTEIYDAAGHHCPLADGDYFGNRRGTPHIVDIYAATHFIALKKVED